jgi:hypothetical protein
MDHRVLQALMELMATMEMTGMTGLTEQMELTEPMALPAGTLMETALATSQTRTSTVTASSM